jgi:hypothetical protein
MVAALLTLTVSRGLTSQQAYDDMRARMDRATSVQFTYGRVNMDAWESDYTVSFRRPNQFSTQGKGLFIVTDGKWYHETGSSSNGTVLRRFSRKDLKHTYHGFESFFEPTVRPKGIGEAREMPIPWRQEQKALQLTLRYPNDTVRLYLDPKSKLPVGVNSTYYSDVVLDPESMREPFRLDPPPSLREALRKMRAALARATSLSFELEIDGDEWGEHFKLARAGKSSYQSFAVSQYTGVDRQWPRRRLSGKEVWQVRDLFGLESYRGVRDLPYFGAPELTVFIYATDYQAWRLRSRLQGSSKEIRIYLDKDTFLPVGYDFFQNGKSTRITGYKNLQRE